MNPPFMQGKYRKQFEAYVAEAIVKKHEQSAFSETGHHATLRKLNSLGSNPGRRANLPS